MYKQAHNQELLDPELLPAIYQWSDMVIKGWIRLHIRGAPFGKMYKFPYGVTREMWCAPKMKQYLNYIVIWGIHQPEATLQIILECLYHTGQFSWGHIPTWDQRVTYPVGSMYAQSTLLTPKLLL